MRKLHTSLLGTSLAAALVLAACADQSPSAPLASSIPQLSNGVSSTLIECETTFSTSVTDTISLLGGTIQVTDAAGGTHSVTFPSNAVAAATVFELSVPASKYVKVDVTARNLLTGEPVDLVFPADAQPTLAVSYQRCTRNDIQKQELRLYNVDGTTNAILEGPFGSKENGIADRRVSGKVPHFSEYAIGTP